MAQTKKRDYGDHRPTKGERRSAAADKKRRKRGMKSSAQAELLARLIEK